MFERFTKRARAVVVAAQGEARAAGASTIRTEHLLLGLTLDTDNLAMRVLGDLGADADSVRRAAREQTSPAPAGDLDEDDLAALRTLGIDGAEVLRRAEEQLGQPLPSAPTEGRRAHVPFAQESKQTLTLALRAAASLHHRYLGTEHVLLGLLAAPDTGAGRALGDLGVTPEAAREAVVERLRSAS
jgi:ATP-dependent Clp protease ATP-binding subunit ClpA